MTMDFRARIKDSTTRPDYGMVDGDTFMRCNAERLRLEEVCRANQSTVDLYKAERDRLRALNAELKQTLNALADKLYKPGDTFGSMWTVEPTWKNARALLERLRNE